MIIMMKMMAATPIVTVNSVIVRKTEWKESFPKGCLCHLASVWARASFLEPEALDL